MKESHPIPLASERPFLDVRETAKVMGKSEDATYRAIARGDIPSIRVGRTLRVPTAALRRMAGLPDEP